MNRSCNVTISVLLFLFWGCAVPPTMKDVGQMADDDGVVFGSIAVYEDEKQEKWGVKFTGSNYFYLAILPPDTSEAITYRLAKDGVFYWTLPPGEYTLLGYHWQDLQAQRTGYIGARFRVPESGSDAYLGTIEFRGNVFSLVPHFQDRFDQIVELYNAKFPDRQGTAVKQLMAPPQLVGSFSAIRGQCHDDWKIKCDNRFRGVTPISPEVSQTGFPVSNTLRPEFRWKGCARKDVSYDLILYEAAAYGVGGQMVPSYMRGRIVAYKEGLQEPRWHMETPLKPETRYIWSVRIRDGETVSPWSTQSHSTFLIVYASSGYGHWFQFKTG